MTLPVAGGPQKAILVKLHKATLLLDRIIALTLHKEVKLSFSHFLILMALGRRTLSQRDIAAFHGVSEAAISRQIELLRRSGFVARDVDPTNRRAHRIVLTKRGEAQLNKALAVLRRRFVRVFSVWTAREQQRIIADLQTLLTHLCTKEFLPHSRLEHERSYA